MTKGPLWTDKSATVATGGNATEPFESDGVAFDSRNVAERDLFVALSGRQRDGHNFVGQAFERGASAAMVEHRPDNIPRKSPLLLVVDTSQGLRDLAVVARARALVRVAAVTGSVGKTSVKEFLRVLLRKQGATHVSEKSFNNHVGTPLSLARMPQHVEYAVFEVGSNAPGEIAPLSSLVRPHVALVTTVEPVHIGNFPDENALAAEKASLFDSIEPDGVAVINGDNRHAELLRRRASDAGAGEIVLFGAGADCDSRLVEWEPQIAGSRVRATIAGREFSYTLPVHGRHQALNSVAVLTVVHHLGADVERAAGDFAEVEALPGRGKRHRVAVNDGEIEVIDESYNASPVAMKAALDVLGRASPGDGGRRIAILGDMAELGARTTSAHLELADVIRAANVDLFFAVGKAMGDVITRLDPMNCGGATGESRTMAAIVTDVLAPGDVVLVKGSRSVGMEVIVDAIRAVRAPRTNDRT